MQLSLQLLLAAVPLLLLLQRLVSWSRSLPLPPGPKGFPLIGNIYDLSDLKGHLWVSYTRWAERYGEIFHYQVFGTHVIVLNSKKAIFELLDRRSYNYSDRPGEYGNATSYFYFQSMTSCISSRLHRRTFHQFFQDRCQPEYYQAQRDATISLIHKLTTNPEHFFEHVSHHSGEVLLKTVYGYTLETEDDKYLQLVHNALEGAVAAANPGSFWVDYFPILKHVPAWFPGAGFKRSAKVWGGYFQDLVDQPWNWTREAMEEGTALPSFCTQSAERHEITPGENSKMEQVIKNCAAFAYSAGTETTVSSILSFILVMAIYPDLQIRAQKELESVVGVGRLPDFEDQDKLPFIQSLISETLRWNPVSPLALPHRALHDDIYEGYAIPEGATVVGNAWAVLHDEELYGANPLEFDPTRFLREDGKVPPNPDLFAFGFGRRICPGRYLALNTIYITMCYLLTTFNITKAIDDEGNEIEPHVQFAEGISSHPLPFKCQFIPRNLGAVTTTA
ncbi:cytochrome P450 [Dendrothele bispora CBS 962.96]|uniref:Cytochrome P450 n=1 Tax=Dendrothele bispora (strain CBS 962.96) TaxID=1314807 RepID=A0A4S8M8T2_DENBC|nr:cytochrome P450 [Dendrothele bispora CBS 962.96]